MVKRKKLTEEERDRIAGVHKKSEDAYLQTDLVFGRMQDLKKAHWLFDKLMTGLE